MKVWMNKNKGEYSGGLLLVAANSAEEAHELCLNSENMEYIYWRNDYDFETKERIKIPVYDRYKWDGWEEIPNLWYTGVKPCIIAEGGYTE